MVGTLTALATTSTSPPWSDLEEAVVLGTPGSSDDGLAPMREAAAAHDVTVVVGANERSGRAGGTVYNSLVTLASDGSIANVHRKLPTHTERIA